MENATNNNKASKCLKYTNNNKNDTLINKTNTPNKSIISYSYELLLRKVFDMKMKNNHEIKSAIVDENDYLKTFYFLKGFKVYKVNIETKAHSEFEALKYFDIVYLSANKDNKILIAGSIKGIIYLVNLKDSSTCKIDNLLFNSIMLELKLISEKETVLNNKIITDVLSNKKPISNVFYNNINNIINNLFILACEDGRKLIIRSDNYVTLWYVSNNTHLDIKDNNVFNNNTNEDVLSDNNNNINKAKDKSNKTLVKTFIKSNSITNLINKVKSNVKRKISSKEKNNVNRNMLTDRSNYSTDSKNTDYSNKRNKELNGTFYTISLINDRNLLALNNISNNDNNNISNYFNSICSIFNNNHYYGNHLRITDIGIYKIKEVKDFKWKIGFIDYIFIFNKSNNMINCYETLSSKTIKNVNYVDIDYNNNTLDNIDYNVIVCNYNKLYNNIVFVLNSNITKYCKLIKYNIDVFKIYSFKLNNLIEESNNNSIDFNSLIVKDIGFVYNDNLIILLFIKGYFAIIDMEFNIIRYVDSSKSIYSIDNNLPVQVSCPIYFNSIKEINNQSKFLLICAYNKDDYFVILSGLYSICYQLNFSNYKDKVRDKYISNIKIESINDLCKNLVYYQLINNVEYNEETNLNFQEYNFDNNNKKISKHHFLNGFSEVDIIHKIHKFISNIFTDNTYIHKVVSKDNEEIINRFNRCILTKAAKKSYYINSVYIRLFTYNNLFHQFNFDMICYFLGIINDYVFYLVSIKEFHSALQIIKLTELYLLRPLDLKKINTSRLNNSINYNLNDKSTFIYFNPHPIYNNSLVSINNKLTNMHFLSKLRLIVFFGCLVEYRYEPEIVENMPTNVDDYELLYLSNDDIFNLDNIKSNNSNNPLKIEESLLLNNNNINKDYISDYTLPSSKFTNNKNKYNFLLKNEKTYIDKNIDINKMNNVNNYNTDYLDLLDNIKNNKLSKSDIAVIQRKTRKLTYFLLANYIIKEFKKFNIKEELFLTTKSLIRNYKYLKSQNIKAGTTDEFVLNGITLNQRTELLSYLLHNRKSRDDINLNFFISFFSIEDIHNYNDIIELYCSGKDVNLIENLEYINHSGKLIKWLFLIGCKLYECLIDDIKAYFYNHFKQYSSTSKANSNKLNFEIENLNSFINFNYVFLMYNILFLIKQSLLISLSSYTYWNNNSSNNNNFELLSTNNDNILYKDSTIFNNNFKKHVVYSTSKRNDNICNNSIRSSFLCNALFCKYNSNSSLFDSNSCCNLLKASLMNPVDLPLFIFEFYSILDNSNNKNLKSWEINQLLYNKFENISKASNISFYDINNLIEILQNKLLFYNLFENNNNNKNNKKILFTNIRNNFIYYLNKEVLNDYYINSNINLSKNNTNDLFDLKYISFLKEVNLTKNKNIFCFIFYVFIIVKLGMIHLIEINYSMLSNCLEESDVLTKRILIEFLYNTLNGLLKYYILLENSNKLCDTNTKYLELILYLIKNLFYKTVREEPFEVKLNIYSFVFISPMIMKPYLTEGALFYEYKSFNKLVKTGLFCINIINNNNRYYVNDVIYNNYYNGLMTINNDDVNLFEIISKVEYIYDYNNEDHKSVIDLYTYLKGSSNNINLFKFLFMSMDNIDNTNTDCVNLLINKSNNKNYISENISNNKSNNKANKKEENNSINKVYNIHNIKTASKDVFKLNDTKSKLTNLDINKNNNYLYNVNDIFNNKNKQELKNLNSKLINQIDNKKNNNYYIKEFYSKEESIIMLQDLKFKLLSNILFFNINKQNNANSNYLSYNNNNLMKDISYNINNFKNTLKNLIEILTLSNYDNYKTINNEDKYSISSLLFSIEPSIEYLRKLIYSYLIEKTDDHKDDVNNNSNINNTHSFEDKINIIIDKIIKVNFDNSKIQIFGFSNKDIRQKLIYSMKSVFARLMHLFVCLKLQLQILTTDNELKKLSSLTLLAIMDEKYSSISIVLKAIDFIKTQKPDFFNNSSVDKSINYNKEVLDIFININYIMLNVDKSLCFPADFDRFLANESKVFYSIYNKYVNNDFEKIKKLYYKLNNNIKYKNTKNFILLIYNNNYVDMLNETYNDLKQFVDCKIKNNKYNFNFNSSFTNKSNFDDFNYMSSARNLFKCLNTNFEKSFGIGTSKFVEFEKNWIIKDNSILLNCILNDSHCNIKNESTINDFSKKQNILANNRQIHGADTPKKNISIFNKRAKIDKFKKNVSNNNNNSNKYIRKSSFIVSDKDVVNVNNICKNNDTKNIKDNKSRNKNNSLSNNTKESNTFNTDDLVDNYNSNIITTENNNDNNDNNNYSNTNAKIINVNKKLNSKQILSNSNSSKGKLNINLPKYNLSIANKQNVKIDVSINNINSKNNLSFASDNVKEVSNYSERSVLSVKSKFIIKLKLLLERSIKRYCFNKFSTYSFNILKNDIINNDLDSFKVLKLTTSKCNNNNNNNNNNVKSNKMLDNTVANNNKNKITSIKQLSFREDYVRFNISI